MMTAKEFNTNRKKYEEEILSKVLGEVIPACEAALAILSTKVDVFYKSVTLNEIRNNMSGINLVLRQFDWELRENTYLTGSNEDQGIACFSAMLVELS